MNRRAGSISLSLSVLPETAREAPVARALPAPLLWVKCEVWTALGISDRTFDRLLSSGQFPPPDVRVGRMPKWKPETIRELIDEHSHKVVKR
jgi:predicted DNA-binding transcriptional regulator AlpA